MGWVKRRLRQLERLSQGGSIVIPQQDGSVRRFAQSALAEAYVINCRRYGGEDIPVHELTKAADNSSDPWWRESVYATPMVVLPDGTLVDPVEHPVEDLSEQASRKER